MNHPGPCPTDIAVIGMSGRFPGAHNIAEYWANLVAGRESITRFTEEELVQAGVSAETLADPNYIRAGYVLDNADLFDAAFFQYSRREARLIDPQQRVLLECAWQALEQAGYMGGENRQIGVYVGSSLNTYLLYSGVAEQFKTEPVLTLMSNDKDFLATRIGYKLNLEGPCVTVQTACSTSLVAVHMACQSILAGECDMALAGGVCVKVPLKAGYFYREGAMFSRDGHCRTFDAAASGTIFGSGAGIVVLKRYTEALRDGDTVLAVVKGSAVNNDGARKASYTAPSVTGLAEVIGQSMDFAQIRADEISYVECHGTGTALGDPVEVHAMTKAFRSSTDASDFCALGSVKTNIGHLEAASGIASFIKTVCCLKNRYLPALLHFQTASPALQLEGSPFYIHPGGRCWGSSSEFRTAAVNSLGVGGTNANVILQEAPTPSVSLTDRKWHLMPVSAKTAAVAQSMKATVLTELQAHPEVSSADAAFTLHVGRRPFDWREVAIVDSRRQHIRDCAVKESMLAKDRPVILLLGDEFDGQLISTLQSREPAFAELFRHARQEVPTMAAEIALVRLWKLWGLKTECLVGDGAGALAIAYLNGESAAPSIREELSTKCRRLIDQYSDALFVPVGSATTLSATVAQLISGSSTQIMVPPMTAQDASNNAPSQILEQAAAIWKFGGTINLGSIYGEEQRRRVPLPPVAFQGLRHWYSAGSLNA